MECTPFTHGPLETEQEPVIEVDRIVDAVLVEDQRLAQGANLEKPMPIGGVSREPGHLKAEHDPGPPHADLGDQLLEPFAIAIGTGEAEIAIDHDDALGRPAQGHGPLAQCVLAARALGIGSSGTPRSASSSVFVTSTDSPVGTRS